MSFCCRFTISSLIDLLGKPNTVLCIVSPLISIYRTNCLQLVVPAVELSTLATLQSNRVIKIISQSLPKESILAKGFLSSLDHVSFIKSQVKSK